jgi:hypothetical protein
LASSRVTSNGPDWSDLEMVIKAVEEFHRVRVDLTISTQTIGSRGGLRVMAVATRRDKPELGARHSVSRSLRIGSGDPAQAVASMFRLIHELDRDCGQMWAQAELFESV